MHCVDLGESFQTHIFLQNLASIQPRTSPVKFARSLAMQQPALVHPSCPGGAWSLPGGRTAGSFSPKLRGARSRLYRRRFLQVNTRWKALAEIYTMHSFAPFSNLNFFVKNRQKILREKIHIFHRNAKFDENFKLRERCKGVHCVDRVKSFPTSTWSRLSASIHLRTRSTSSFEKEGKKAFKICSRGT